MRANQPGEGLVHRRSSGLGAFPTIARNFDSYKNASCLLIGRCKQDELLSSLRAATTMRGATQSSRASLSIVASESDSRVQQRDTTCRQYHLDAVRRPRPWGGGPGGDPMVASVGKGLETYKRARPACVRASRAARDVDGKSSLSG
jgi:hypothetical protein